GDAEMDVALQASAAGGDGTEAEASPRVAVRTRALMLFTAHEHVHAAFREGANVLLPRSGEFDGAAFCNLSVAGPDRRPHAGGTIESELPAAREDLAAEITRELDARHAGPDAVAAAPPPNPVETPAAEREWPILAQLPFGVMVVSPEGRITTQYSAATPAIFARFALPRLEGTELAVLLGLDVECLRAFRAAYAELFHDDASASAAARRLPSRVHVGCRMYHATFTVLRDGPEARASGATREASAHGVLVTLHDASAQREAERRAERQEATANILRFRDAFATFARELDGNLDRAVRQGTFAENPRAVRATLHTAKGVFAQFGLTEMVERIHEIESEPAIAQESLRNLRAAFRALVLERRSFWGVDLGNPEARYTVAESALRDLEVRAARAADVQSLRAVLRAGLSALRDKTASELLGPIGELATELAERRGKHLRVFVEGGDVPIPTRFVGVLGNLVHLVRNAVDHGLEPAAERGEKDPVGTIVLAVARGSSGLRITVSDDGRGIDVEKLGSAAVRLGLTTSEAFDHMRASAKLDLLFSLGLSTAETVTDTSGRGVGTAAVRAAVEAAGGRIEVQNHPGSGATFTIVLPIEGQPRTFGETGADRPWRLSDRPGRNGTERPSARASARPAGLPSAHPSAHP
ncbi:MAG: sensor histidine kinase, partial [Polyangiaceae bacterium]|nr:sensor histidine kinase [Polyangiaceae bacterium]